MFDLVLQTLAYAGVGVITLIVGFFVLDLLTPGKLAEEIVGGNVSACVIAAATLVSLGMILWFAIFFTGAGWRGLDNCAIFGAVGVAAQALAWLTADAVTPGKLGQSIAPANGKSADAPVTLHPGVFVTSSMQIAVAFIICASLT